MFHLIATVFRVALFAFVSLALKIRADDFAAALPDGVKAVWDFAKAQRETTPTRERICLNGLWRWQPADSAAEKVPAGKWGFFKVPGCWPGITDYMQKDSQTLHAHPGWKNVKPGAITAAWHEREMTVPGEWAGRRISLHAEYVNSFAVVFVDGVKVGEIHFPGGDVEITAACRPGATQRVSLLVVALPLKGVMLSYTDSASAREVKGKVERRGLCGDVFLISTPRGARIADASVETSVRKRELTIRAAATGLEPDASYIFRVRVMKGGAVVKEFASAPFRSGELKDGRFAFTEKWMPDKLWDLHTPQNTFDLEVSLVAGGRVLDTDWTQRFGFREFWIEGRDFHLNGSRIFLSAVPLQISDAEKANLRWEAKQFRAGSVWHRWDYPNPVGSDRFDERYPVFAMYLTDNWRAYRTWGVSGISPWEYEHFWKLRAGVDKSRKGLATDWEKSQRPGFSPDYFDQRYERMDMAFERADWIATPAAQALIRNNCPLLAYIAGKPDAFTSKDHNFLPGETVEKQIVVINNSREPVTCEAGWLFGVPQPMTGKREVTVAAGEQARIPLTFELPKTLAAGSYEVRLTAKFGSETQEDRFVVNVLPEARPAPNAKVALFDPKGETEKLLAALGIRAELISADTDLSPFEILVIGKGALTVGGPAPGIGRVRDGLKAIVFEQTSDVLEKRLGFRVEEYGLRQLFPRVPDHPLLAGIEAANLRDWRGSATILPPRLKYEMRSRYGPTVEWAGIPVTRAWRCGNRGNVASVLIEKPARGDFLPILDGGFSLQYSPLLEYREGKGMVLFCQLDVTGRTENDPTAATLVRNIMRHVSEWKSAPRRKTVYAGEPAGKAWLESAGVTVRAYDSTPPSNDDVLVLGPGGGRAVAKDAAALADFVKTGGNVLAIGLDQEDAAALPIKVTMKKAEHISSFFESFGASSLLAGIGPADIHNRDPRELALVSSGAEVIGDGVLAKAENSNVVFVQMPPWQFTGSQQSNLRRTFRHAAVLLDRLLGNMGVAGSTPLLERFDHPVDVTKTEKRWLDGLYLDQPEEWDDPYRFFRW